MSGEPASIRDSVSVLGLGAMGSALASVFIRKGWKTTLWNRSPDKAKELTAQGGILATSAAECIRSSPLSIICVKDSDAFNSLFAGQTFGHDPIIVNYTTASPSQAKEAERAVRATSISRYLQGAILTPPVNVGQPGAQFYYSGSKSAFNNGKSALNLLGTPHYLDEAVESAVVYDTIVLSSFYGLTAGFIQSMAVLRKSNIYEKGCMESFTRQAIIPTMRQVVESLAGIARQMDEQKYTTEGGGPTNRSQVESLHIMEAAVQEHGLKSLVFKPLLELMQRRFQRGGAEEEVSGLVEAMLEEEAKP